MKEILKHLDLYLEQQLAVWPEAYQAFNNLEHVQTRTVSESGIILQHNPARIISTAAKIKPADVALRNCFLCQDNRPQKQLTFHLDDQFDLLVNPYPIVPEHFCVVSTTHTPQIFKDCHEELLKIASLLEPNYMVFYNGPRSGASAPDHLHMQIGRSDNIPLVQHLIAIAFTISEQPTVIHPFGFPVIVVKGKEPDRLMKIVDSMLIHGDEVEPRINVLSINHNGEVITAIIPRTKHRPNCYYYHGADMVMVSPGAIDMFGLIITPRKEDYLSLTEKQIMTIYNEVTPQQPMVKVGIMAAPQISICLNDVYSDGTYSYEGGMEISLQNGCIRWRNILTDSVTLTPSNSESTFTLHNVSIGLGFHWERQEDQTFGGEVMFVADHNLIQVINIVPVEEYLTSVISSEMKPTAPIEFLKAHAIISRSWLMAQLRHPHLESDTHAIQQTIQGEDPNRRIIWYDHDSHTLFDVCADDHCQRYQGRTRIISPAAKIAVHETAGQILTFEGELCDARFSKCCGGVVEQFETCWQDEHKPYLIPLRDNDTPHESIPSLDLEYYADKWIHSQPDAFCNPAGHQDILARSLNGYDLETPDYFRWQVTYNSKELSQLFTRKTGIDLGEIEEIAPIRRGPSGRIYELEITGTLRTITIGKELEIRRALSPTHLLSSAFTVQKSINPQDLTIQFTFHGAGWGHGVGLCQIGAAVMADQGYSHKEILLHYYPGTTLTQCY